MGYSPSWSCQWILRGLGLFSLSQFSSYPLGSAPSWLLCHPWLVFLEFPCSFPGAAPCSHGGAAVPAQLGQLRHPGKTEKKNPNVMERQHLPPRHSLSQGHLSKTSSFYFLLLILSALWDNLLPSFPGLILAGRWEKGKALCCAGSTGLAPTPNPSVGKGNSIPGRASQDLQLHPKVLKEFFSPFRIFPEPEKNLKFKCHGIFPRIL